MTGGPADPRARLTAEVPPAGPPRAVVCVPWRGGNEHRERCWRLVRDRWDELGLEIFTGDVPGPFNRSAARNAAARDAGAWDVAIFVDADTLGEQAVVTAALERAATTGRIVVPHDEYLGLSAGGTADVLAGRRAGWSRVTKRIERAPLGVLVVPRSAWDTLGGFDERFVDWGGEDVAFGIAARTLVGIDRLAGRIWHLWHPMDPTKRDYVRAGGTDLRNRYSAAAKDPDLMRALLAEREDVAA